MADLLELLFNFLGRIFIRIFLESGFKNIFIPLILLVVIILYILVVMFKKSK